MAALRWLSALASVLLAGCVVLPPPAGEGGLPAADIDAFLLEGKVAWRHEDGRGNANLSWWQDGDAFLLLLTGPLGHGAVRIESDADGVRLETPEGPIHAATADELLQEALGFSVPVAQARWWVLGLPAVPGPAEILQRDGQGRPQILLQDGWRIEWRDRRLVEDYALPRRVELTRAGLQLTLVIGAWSLASGASVQRADAAGPN